MHVKTMEGLVGARTNMNLLNTPMRVYREARRRGDTAAMERSMGYVGEYADKAEEYKAEADKGMEEDARETREKAKSGREEAVRKCREERGSLEVERIKEDEIMAMEISNNYRDYKNDYSERLQEAGKDKVKELGREQGAENESESIPVLKDEYISSEKSGSRPSGLYRMGKDENGNPRVLYDDPRKHRSADGKGQPEVKADSLEDPAEKCTGNTDKVDREIEKLKAKKQQLEQQITAASEDEKKVKELEKKLSRIESELNQKDNDTYRRQHTVFY